MVHGLSHTGVEFNFYSRRKVSVYARYIVFVAISILNERKVNDIMIIITYRKIYETSVGH